jgi:hypothetical protein
MKLQYKAIIAGGVLLIALGSFYVFHDRTKLVDEINTAKGKYEAYRQLTIASEAVSAKVIREQLGKIDELNGAIDSANGVIAGLEQGQTNAGNAIVKLKESLSQAKTDAEKVPILESLVAEWTIKFNLAQDTIAEKDKIIFSLTAKYQSQLVISERYKADWTDETSLRKMAETRLSLLDKRVGSLEKKLRLRNVGDVLLIAGAVFLAFK